VSPSELIKLLTDELNAATAHREQLKSELTTTRQQLKDALPQLRERLYAPLWMIPRAVSGPTPNTLWLITSIALTGLGLWMLS
jgi:hypothetical protein